MSAAASSSQGGAEGGTHPPGEEEQGESSAYYECNICLDTAKDPVVSMCGHLFCWPCLHQWLETRPNRQMCPVCKAGIGKDKVVPIYGRGCTKSQDPRMDNCQYETFHSCTWHRHAQHGHLFHGKHADWVSCPEKIAYSKEKLPPRPAGQRPEPENAGGVFPGFGFGDGGFHMSFGIGAFPFGMFASTFNLNDGRPGPPPPASPQHAEEQFLSKFFIWVAVLFIFWLLIA